MPSKHRELYDKLKSEGFYTKSYDTFVTQFANPDKLIRLYGLMQQDGLYTKRIDDFKSQFFSPLAAQKDKDTNSGSTEYKKVRLRDERQVEQATGSPLSDKMKFHAEIDTQYLQQVTATARKHGVDPYTALAINLAETGFDPEQMKNPFMLGNYNQYGDVVDESIKYMANQQKYAKKLGKKKEEDIIQAWNGYGTLKDRGNLYGIDTNKTPIDMNKNPIYGKRILDLRENVIKRNPDIKNIVDGVLASNPQYDRKFWPSE